MSAVAEDGFLNAFDALAGFSMHMRPPANFIGDVARVAAVDRWTMRDILREHGVKLRLGLVDETDAADGRAAANELEFDADDSDDEESPTD